MEQIIALGGGGFSMEPENLALDRYILRQARCAHPKVCFIPTASGDADSYILNFYKSLSTLDCQPSFLSLFRLPTADLEGFVLEKDVLYVGGGNTRSMLALWRDWGLDAILHKAYETGVVLAGISAGANCWFEQFSTDSVPGELQMMGGLEFLPGSFTPHYDGEAERRPSLHRMLQAGKILPGLAADNSAGAHFVDGQMVRAICSQPGAKVYRMGISGGRVIEEALEMEMVE